MGLEHLGSMDIQSTQTTIENGVPHTESFSAQIEGLAIIQFLMSYTITSWIASFLVYAIGGFFVLYVSIFTAVIVIGFWGIIQIINGLLSKSAMIDSSVAWFAHIGGFIFGFLTIKLGVKRKNNYCMYDDYDY